jgi:DNA-binding GntR family transcriptional regulator
MTAAYRQVADAVRLDIISGKYAPGERLPSLAQLAEEHGRTRAVAQHAMTWLVAQGYAINEHGRGTFVSQSLPSSAPTLVDLQRQVEEQRRELERLRGEFEEHVRSRRHDG